MLSRYWPILLGLIYLLLPVDTIPDVFLGPGFIDDALVLGLLYWLFLRKPAPDHTGDRYRGSRREDPGGATGDGATDREQNRTAAGGKDRARDPYAILEIDRKADFAAIRKAYHRQANRYHPDKVSHLGREFQELAKVKFQDVQWAYETLAGSKEST